MEQEINDKRKKVLLNLLGYYYNNDQKEYIYDNKANLCQLRLIGYLLGEYRNVSELSEKEQKIYAKIPTFLENENKTVDVRRWFYPDFLKEMNKKIEMEKFERYMCQIVRVKKLILSMNSNEDVLDKISVVIDGGDFAEACSTENDFIVSELEILDYEIKEICEGFDEKKDGINCVISQAILIGNDVEKEIELRNRIGQKYDKIDKMSRAKKIIIKPENDEKLLD